MRRDDLPSEQRLLRREAKVCEKTILPIEMMSNNSEGPYRVIKIFEKYIFYVFWQEDYRALQTMANKIANELDILMFYLIRAYFILPNCFLLAFPALTCYYEETGIRTGITNTFLLKQTHITFLFLEARTSTFTQGVLRSCPSTAQDNNYNMGKGLNIINCANRQ
ncbi:hypothetical protein ACJX0J_007666 [Zea mays]